MFFTLHKWMGLTAALFIFVMAATGSALTFEGAIFRSLHPSLSYVSGGGAPLPISDLVRRANAARPDDPVRAMQIAEKPEFAWAASSPKRRSTFLNPYTGEILGSADPSTGLARTLHLIHTEFLLGDIGEKIAGWSTVLMLLLSLTGLVVWWPRRIFTVKTGSSWKRTNFDLHHAVGFYSSVIMILISAAGILIAFERTTDRLVLKLNGSAAAPSQGALESTPSPGSQRITPDDAIGIAAAALPGARATIVSFPGGAKGVYAVFEKFPEDRTPAGRSRVFIDQYSGTVLRLDNTRTAALGTRIVNVKRAVHTGDLLGAPTEAVWCVVSLGVALQAVTGALMWWNARTRSRR